MNVCCTPSRHRQHTTHIQYNSNSHFKLRLFSNHHCVFTCRRPHRRYEDRLRRYRGRSLYSTIPHTPPNHCIQFKFIFGYLEVIISRCSSKTQSTFLLHPAHTSYRGKHDENHLTNRWMWKTKNYMEIH